MAGWCCGGIRRRYVVTYPPVDGQEPQTRTFDSATTARQEAEKVPGATWKPVDA